MKYQVGDLLLVKKYEYKTRPYELHPHHRLHPNHRHRTLFLLHPLNTFGIIIAVEKHSDIFMSDSTENDNGYIWYSQFDGEQYFFFEDEVVGEVIK